MGTPIAFNSGTTASYDAGVFKKGTIALNLANSLVSGYNWWNGVDVTSSQYLIYSDTFSQGQATFANSRPTAWTTPDLTDASLVALINTLPDRVGLPGFTDVTSAVNWMNQTGKYYLVKTGYDDIVTTNLQFNVDAGWYPSYPGSGTSWFDTSPNTTTSTLFNGVGFNSSSGGALAFDGADDYVVIPDVSSLDIPTAITVETWVYYTAQGGTQSYSVITHKGYPWNWLLEDQGGIFNFRITTSNSSDSNLSTGYAHGLNKWSHFVATYDGSSQKVYVNGVLLASQSLTGTIDTSASGLYIGTYTPSTYNLTGRVAIVRIYSSALSQSNIVKNFNAQRYRFGLFENFTTSNLVVNLLANDNLSYVGSGTNWIDISGNQNSASLINGPSWNSTGYFTFDGTDDYGSITDNSTVDITNQISLEATIYVTKSTGTQNVICKSSDSQNNGYIYPRTDNGWNSSVFYLNTGNWNTLAATWPSLNNWHHTIATWDGKTMKIYINGALSVSQSVSGTISTNSNPLTLGNQPGYSEYFGGRISSARVYNRALSATEVLQNYYGATIVTDGLSALYDANNLVSYPTTGSVWKDLSGNGNDMSWSSPAATFTTYNSVNVISTVNSYTTLRSVKTSTYNNMRTGSGGYTVMSFFRPNATTTNQILISFGPANNQCDGENVHPIAIGSSGKFVGGSCGGRGTWTSSAGVTATSDRFWCVCTTYDGSTETVYVNGVFDKSAAMTSNTPVSASNAISLGWIRDDGAIYSMNASIGVILIYNRTLTPIEVSQNFNAYKSRFGL